MTRPAPERHDALVITIAYLDVMQGLVQDIREVLFDCADVGNADQKIRMAETQIESCQNEVLAAIQRAP